MKNWFKVGFALGAGVYLGREVGKFIDYMTITELYKLVTKHEVKRAREGDERARDFCRKQDIDYEFKGTKEENIIGFRA